MVATKVDPQLLNDHKPGSRVTDEASTASPHPAQFVASCAVAPLKWACPFEVPGVAVPKAPLVIVVKSGAEIPV